ncbi:MAG: hypothetical protein HW421_4171 [Ignavibacteria bacterium]|nr:hypothetical protein [Ignavibacteria bacterium]
MKAGELKELLDIEFGFLDVTLESITELNAIIGSKQPDKFQLAAMSKLLSDMYNGTENVLKRICKYLTVPLPTGGFYHTELFLLFCKPPKNNCPLLFNDLIFDDYKALLKFRHYVIHGYAFQLEWNIIKNSVQRTGFMISHFKSNVLSFLKEII